MKCSSDEGQSDTMFGNTRYLDPTNDLAFKKLFGAEGHKDLLISFLNTMLRLEGKQQICQVTLLPPEMAPVISKGKRSILDVSCIDATGRRYIVEMQNQHVPEFVKRAQMYASHAYSTQLKRGTTHLELSPVILLAVTNYTIFPKKKPYISYHKVLDTQTLENDLKDVSYVFIELSKFKKDQEADLETLEDKWLFFLKYWADIKRPPKSVTEPEILQAYDAMERFNWNTVEFDHYLKTHMAAVEEQAALEESYNKGRKQERLKAEREKVAIAKRLLEQGLDVGVIAKATGIKAKLLTQTFQQAG